MKISMFLMLLLMIPVVAFGQFQKERMVETVEVVPPRFTGVESVNSPLPETYGNELNQFLLSNILYPEDDVKSYQDGVEVIRFTIYPEGKVGDFEVINSVSTHVDTEVIRVLRETDGMWLPGLNNSNPTEMQKEVSIAFCCGGVSSQEVDERFLHKAKWYFNRGNKRLFLKGNTKKALNAYNNAIRYLPNETGVLMIRGLCRFELGDQDGACKDWNRIVTLGGSEGDFFLQNVCDMKGYDEMLSILKNEK